MRVLHLGKYYPPSPGGMETVLANLAEGLVAAGDDVTVLVAGGNGAPPLQAVEGPGRPAGGRVIRLPVQGLLNSQPLVLDLPAALRRVLAAYRPELVHLHLPNPLAAAGWMLLRAGGVALPPLVVWHHADMTRQRVGRFLVGPVVQGCLAAAAGICVSSGALREGSRELRRWRDKVEVIPFGIVPEPWCSIEPSRGPRFLFVGRLVAYKGLDSLLEALQLTPDLEVDIVGDGPLGPRLRRTVAAGDLRDRVAVHGWVPESELVRLMGRSRALVLPSLDAGETFGLVQLEAMASGLPVIASDLPTGVAEVGIRDRTTILCPPGDGAALAAAMAGLLADGERAAAMGIAGRRLFRERYHRDSMVSGLRRWYAGILAAG